MGWAPDWLKKAGKYSVRAGTGLASGGASELYRASTGKADPVTAKGEELVDKIGDSGGDTGPAPTGETPEERARREQLDKERDEDLKKARAYRDKALGEPAPLPRVAPVVNAPTVAAPVHAGAPSQVSSTLNTGDVDQARA